MPKLGRILAVVTVVLFTFTRSDSSSGGDEVLKNGDLTGSVRDVDGQPVAAATVRVWTASVKKGYSTFCPSCYVDCGKRVTTDADGTFTLPRLNGDLRFRLLIVGNGYAPTFVDKVDPLGAPISAILPRREKIGDFSRLVRGRVVGPTGEAIRDAVIEPELVWFLNKNGGLSGSGGAVKGLDPLAVSNDKGEFEIAYAKPAVKMTLMIKARGLAPKRFDDLSTGEEHHRLSISAGATIQGRLMHQGKPVADAEMGLVSKDRSSDAMFSEVRIGTRRDGTFSFTNVPSLARWCVYGKMNSIVQYGATEVIECTTRRDDEIVDLGDIEIRPGHRFRGQVILTDGKPIAEGMQISISGDRAWDSQSAILPPDGRFAFANIPSDDYSINASVKGYRLSDKNPSLSWSIEGVINDDVDDFIILLDPGTDDFTGRSAGKFSGKALQSAPKP